MHDTRDTTTERGRPAWVRWLIAGSVLLAVAGCGTNRFESRPPAWADTLQRPTETIEQAQPAQPLAQPATDEASATTDKDPGFYRPGSGVLLNRQPAVADARQLPDGDVKLNFQNANLREVIKVILGDMLGSNYSVDPAVQGSVSMQTTNALQRDDLVPALEMLLRMNNAALVPDDNGYRVVPLANALAEVRAPQLGDSTLALPAGFSVRVVPLRYVSAEEMAQILTPFIGGSNQILRVDSARNLLILAGTGGEMERLLDTVRMFDVDRMRGMSVAMFTPDFVDAKTLAEDLEQLLADPEKGLMAGLVRFVVVERLNGLMVVTPRAEYLERVREWVERLDRNTGDASPRLFVYRVQNGKAVELAAMLNDLFGNQAASQAEPVELAPGLKPATVGQRRERPPLQTAERAAYDERPEGQQPPDTATPAADNTPPAAPGGGVEINRNAGIQIIADEPNNALLVLARGKDYRQILAALRQLDVSPMQVLIEVTIAEVTLVDELKFGVEWFFRNAVGNGGDGEGLLDLGAAGIGALTPGFSYAIRGSGDTVRFVLNTLATESNLSIISSPSLLVLNNQEANIQVGEDIPILVSQRVPDVGENQVNSVEYRKTGVLLKVKPRVNAGGLVIMEVEQETSQAPTTDTLELQRIQQRRIASTVAVNSGDTIILGGLIQENRDLSESGVPLVHKIPGIGALFGTKADNQNRTELIVLITPRAISNSTAALQVTEEFRRRLQKLIPSREAGSDAAPAPTQAN